jgi:hypothetical protein
MYKQNYLNVYFNDDGNLVIVASDPSSDDIQRIDLSSIVIGENSIQDLISALKTAQDAVENMGGN